MPKSLFDKLWEAHEVAPGAHLHRPAPRPRGDQPPGLRGAAARRPQGPPAGRTVATADHNVPTDGMPIADPIKECSAEQIETLQRNCASSASRSTAGSEHQGIVHIIGPELGLTQPGMTIVCGDSHTATHGAFGALAFGIGTSEVEHVLATQSLLQTSPRRCGSATRASSAGASPPRT